MSMYFLSFNLSCQCLVLSTILPCGLRCRWYSPGRSFGSWRPQTPFGQLRCSGHKPGRCRPVGRDASRCQDWGTLAPSPDGNTTPPTTCEGHSSYQQLGDCFIEGAGMLIFSRYFPCSIEKRDRSKIHETRSISFFISRPYRPVSFCCTPSLLFLNAP